MKTLVDNLITYKSIPVKFEVDMLPTYDVFSANILHHSVNMLFDLSTSKPVVYQPHHRLIIVYVPELRWPQTNYLLYQLRSMLYAVQCHIISECRG